MIRFHLPLILVELDIGSRRAGASLTWIASYEVVDVYLVSRGLASFRSCGFHLLACSTSCTQIQLIRDGVIEAGRLAWSEIRSLSLRAFEGKV